MIRLRQVALVAHDLEAVERELCTTFDLTICHRDPGVGEFGLENGLMVVGDQFVEVVSPTTDGTTAGRLLDKRGGDGGYMVIYEVDELDARLTHLADHDVRIVLAGDFATIRGRHLHPRDVGGALVSIDQATPPGSWAWAGPTWQPHTSSVVSAIAGVSLAANDPDRMRARWAELGIDVAVDFVEVGDRGEGIDGVDLVAVDRRRAGASASIGGVDFRLV